MAQILQRPPTWAEALSSGTGQGLAQGLGKGIDSLAQLKMGQMQQQAQTSQLAQALKGIKPGMSDTEAYQIASGGPQISLAYIKHFLDEPGKLAATDMLNRLANKGQDIPTGFTPDEGDLGQYQAPDMQQPGSPEAFGQEGMAQESGFAPDQYAPQQQVTDQQGTQPQQVTRPQGTQPPRQQPTAPVGIDPRMALDILKFANEQERLDISKERNRLLEKRIDVRSRDKVRDRNMDYRDSLLQKQGSLDLQKSYIKNMRNAAESGDLNSPWVVKFAEKFDIPSLLTPTTQEMIKTSSEYFKNAIAASDQKGGITNFMAEQFMKASPSAKNSIEGLKAITDSLKLATKVNQAYIDAAKKVEKEHGLYAENYETLVNNEAREKSKKYTKKLANTMKKVIDIAGKQDSNIKLDKDLKKELRVKFPDTSSIPNGAIYIDRNTGKQLAVWRNNKWEPVNGR